MRGLFCAIAIVALLAPQVASAALFAVADPAFGSSLSNRVARGTPSGATIRRSALSDGRLYFSLTIVGDADTLAWHEERGRLPFYITFRGDESRFDTVDIGIMPEKWEHERKRFAAEIEERGIFTFRTHYNTRKINFHRIELTLKDGDGNTIRTVSGSRNINPVIELEP